MKYLVDTNILSECIKSTPNPGVMQMLEKHQQETVTASPVWHELEFGCRRLPESRKKDIIKLFINDVLKPNMMVLPYDMRAATWHATERQRLTAIGQPPSFVDGQIAAISVVNDLVLVTRNLKDYLCFNDLKLENWYTPLNRNT